MAAIYSNGDNRWNILGFNFTKRDALSSVYKIFMTPTPYKGTSNVILNDNVKERKTHAKLQSSH
jgi:hypothetical protein